jgi:hypothetical protein
MGMCWLWKKSGPPPSRTAGLKASINPWAGTGRSRSSTLHGSDCLVREYVVPRWRTERVVWPQRWPVPASCAETMPSRCLHQLQPNCHWIGASHGSFASQQTSCFGLLPRSRTVRLTPIRLLGNLPSIVAADASGHRPSKRGTFWRPSRSWISPRPASFFVYSIHGVHYIVYRKACQWRKCKHAS